MNEFDRVRRSHVTDVEFARAVAQIRTDITEQSREIAAAMTFAFWAVCLAGVALAAAIAAFVLAVWQ